MSPFSFCTEKSVTVMITKSNIVKNPYHIKVMLADCGKQKMYSSDSWLTLMNIQKNIRFVVGPMTVTRISYQM